MKKIAKLAVSALRTLQAGWLNLNPNEIQDMSCRVPNKRKSSSSYYNPWKF